MFDIRTTKITHFDKVDRVEHVQNKVKRASDGRLLRNQRQIGNKVERIGDKVESRLFLPIVAMLSTLLPVCTGVLTHVRQQRREL